MSVLAKIRTPIFQIGLSALTACLGTQVSKEFGPSANNLLWLLLIPALIAMLLNRDMMMRVGMACVLMIVSVLSSTAFMAIVWGGY